MEKLEILKNGQWLLKSIVHEEDVSSHNTDPSINPALGGKYGKIHGGDPRKLKNGRENKSNLENEFVEQEPGKKPKKRISGASALRTNSGGKTKNEAGNPI